MFRGYIKPKSNNGGCRGGIRRYANTSDDYAIEIGADCYCQAEPAVVASYTDEILEFLEMIDSPIAKMLLTQIRKGIEEFNNQCQK